MLSFIYEFKNERCITLYYEHQGNKYAIDLEHVCRYYSETPNRYNVKVIDIQNNKHFYVCKDVTSQAGRKYGLYFLKGYLHATNATEAN